MKFSKNNLLIAGWLAFLCLFTMASGEDISVPSVGINTIGQAMMNAKFGDTIWASDGVYREHIFIKAGVALKARNAFKAIIDGKGKGAVVTLSINSTLHGFEIRNGTIGVFSKDVNNAIINCRIVKNWMTGIICVRHLPKIEDNIIAFNKASGIQGWDVRSTNASINHNTIAFNANNGIALGGASDIIIENNMITFNERFGIKLSTHSEKTQLNKNNLFGNLTIGSNVPPNNYAFDPKFPSPRSKMNFSVVSILPCCAYGSDNRIIGVRPLD
ncbi:MAG: right-handed parallel beta-helix repeat-containing protein [Chitinivibrionales bacterium]